MKLTQINDVKRLITEGHVDPNVLLSLQNIIKAGKAYETMQHIVLCRLVEFFKTGRFYKETNFYDPHLDTPAASLQLIRNMKPEEQVELAKKLLELCEVKDKDALYALVNPTQEALMWIRWVTGREAND